MRGNLVTINRELDIFMMIMRSMCLSCSSVILSPETWLCGNIYVSYS